MLERIRAISSIVLLAFLASVCAVPGLMLLRSDRETVSTAENRELAAVPALPSDWAALAEWPQRVEDFVGDHFGLRGTLVRGYNLIHVTAGVSPMRRIVVGKAGWLFLEQTRLGELNRGAVPLSAPRLARLIESFESRHRYLAGRGVAFAVLAAPDKHSLYPEYLPASLKIVGPSRFQQFRDAALEADFQLVDALAALQAAKAAGEPIYYRGDSHWNCRGAWVAYRALMAKLREAGYRGGRELDEAEVEFSRPEQPRATDLVRNLLNLDGLIEEPNDYVCRIAEPAEFIASRPDDDRVFDYVYAAPPGKEHRRYRRTTPRDHSRVLVYRDSYANAMLPFLIHTFDEVIYAAPPRPLAFDPADVDRYDPDLVIYQFVERSLYYPPNDKLLEAALSADGHSGGG